MVTADLEQSAQSLGLVAEQAQRLADSYSKLPSKINTGLGTPYGHSGHDCASTKNSVAPREGR